MENIETFTIVSALVGMLVLYVIIRVAVDHGSNSRYKDRQLWIQTAILIKMAKSSGVSEAEIQKIIDEVKN